MVSVRVWADGQSPIWRKKRKRKRKRREEEEEGGGGRRREEEGGGGGGEEEEELYVFSPGMEKAVLHQIWVGRGHHSGKLRESRLGKPVSKPLHEPHDQGVPLLQGQLQ